MQKINLVNNPQNNTLLFNLILITVLVMPMFGVNQVLASYINEDAGDIPLQQSFVVEPNSKGEVLPIGSIITSAYNGCPDGTIKANGQSTSSYPELAALISGGNPVPDLRGEFIRGWDLGRGVDRNRILGSIQADSVENLFAAFDNQGSQDFRIRLKNTPSWTSTQYAFDGRGDGSVNENRARNKGLDILSQGTGETRPRNVALIYCIVSGQKI